MESHGFSNLLLGPDNVNLGGYLVQNSVNNDRGGMGGSWVSGMGLLL
jgi:hypothetical protein